MKPTAIITSLICAASLLQLGGCNTVDEEDRFIPAEIVPQRAILLEEFTGQMCTNCPDGHQAIREITATLGDSVVAVGIHASNLAINPPIGLKTATGEAYYTNAGSPVLPTGVINLQTDPLQVSDWGSNIDRLIMTPTPFTVKAEGTAIDGNYEIKVAFSSGEDYEGRLMVWVVENDIVGRQLDHGTMVSDYVHNHVFRAAVTSDIMGEEVGLKADTPQYRDYSIEISPYWKAKDLYVVAFLYNSGGVAQVTASSSH